MRKIGWALMTTLAIAVAGYALAAAFVPDMRQGFVVRLFADKEARAFGHLAFGGVALAVGAFQFSRRLRARNLALHRWMGRVYGATVAVSGIAAVLLAFVSTGGVVAHWGFGLLGALWLVTTAIALWAIRAGRVQSHREWMIRSYALCLAAVTLRIYLPFGVASVGFDAFYPAVAWLCWVPNLIVAEWLVIPATRPRTSRATVG